MRAFQQRIGDAAYRPQSSGTMGKHWAIVATASHRFCGGELSVLRRGDGRAGIWSCRPIRI